MRYNPIALASIGGLIIGFVYAYITRDRSMFTSFEILEEPEPSPSLLSNLIVYGHQDLYKNRKLANIQPWPVVNTATTSKAIIHREIR